MSAWWFAPGGGTMSPSVRFMFIYFNVKLSRRAFNFKDTNVHNILQEDGRWTDQPRCTEHVAGSSGQVTPFCPGVPGIWGWMFAIVTCLTCLTCPGYCSLDYPGGLCTFQCSRGPHIRSSCNTDGTWAPYPTCQVTQGVINTNTDIVPAGRCEGTAGRLWSLPWPSRPKQAERLKYARVLLIHIHLIRD